MTHNGVPKLNKPGTLFYCAGQLIAIDMANAIHNRSAYTLVELVMLLGIIGIMAAIAGPRYANALSDFRATAAAQRIAGDLNLARTQARTSSLGQSVTFDINANTYWLPGLTAMKGETGGYNLKLSRDPYQAALRSVSFQGSWALTYDRYGQPSAGGTVTVQSGIYIKTINIDAVTGAATVQ